MFYNGYEYMPSTRKGKKLMTYVDGRVIHFGESGYEHYFDKTRLLDPRLNHLDDERRANYHNRHCKIMLKSGVPAYTDDRQPAYHSLNVLW